MLPVMAVLLGLLLMVAMLFINTFGFFTLVNRAADSAGHEAGLAALQQVKHNTGLARWDIDPVGATIVARDYAGYNLQGMTEGNPASVAGYHGFVDLSNAPGGATDLAELMHLISGTNSGTVDGMDVEIIVPAVVSGQASYHYFNCDTTGGPGSPCPLVSANSLPASAQNCDTTSGGNYPQAVGSSITGECYTHSTVILRIRLHAIQLATGSSQVDKIIVTQAGTNTNG